MRDWSSDVCSSDLSDFAGTCRELLRQRNVTLLYAARNAGCNHALVLQAWLSARMHDLPDR